MLKNLKEKSNKTDVHIVEAVTHRVQVYVLVKTPHGKPTQRAENT